MRTKHLAAALAILACLAIARPHAQTLGTINFPTSGAAAAQPAFFEGVKYLHSFQFEEAAEAFRRAQKADPGFAMAYWGEAMSHNHPLWAQLDVPASKAALEKLAPTPQAQVAKAGTPKEKAYFEAAHLLFFAPGDKLARDNAYSQAMARMHAQWPEDHEIATFYALSLLGTVRPGETGFRRQALAASLVEPVFKANANHPGAAHFIIHAFDDPDHAPLALTAARSYAKIAPSAAHALHMPSHTFIQLGMWDDVIKSNVVANNAANEVNARLKLPEGREDFHTLSWLLYGNLMAGKFDEAAKNVAVAKAAAERNPTAAAVQNGYLGMRARYILETGKWEKIPVADAAPASSAEHANMPGMPGMAPQVNGTWTFIAGMSAAKLGDIPTAQKAEGQLRAMRQRIEADGNAYAAKSVAIMEKEVGAVTKLAEGQKDEAVRLAKEAAEIEATMAAPSGPPEPIKPARELYADVLLEAGRLNDAAIAYEQALLRTPNRTPSVKGLARARAQASR